MKVYSPEEVLTENEIFVIGVEVKSGSGRVKDFGIQKVPGKERG